MSLIFKDGNYKIFSTLYPGQDADLIQGLPTAIIAGYHNNTESNNMVWKLTNTGALGNQFTLQNQAPTSHGAYAGVAAGVSIGAQLHGSTTPLTWTIVGTCNPGEYMLLAPAASGSQVPSGLVWSLGSGADVSPITLEVMFSTSSSSMHSRAGSYGSAWNFLPMR